MPRRNRRDTPRHAYDPDFDAPREAAVLPVRRDTDAAQHLENLRVALKNAQPELYVRLERPTGRPARLRITNPDMPDGSEEIYHRAGSRGGDYEWSWAQVIGPSNNPDKAAAVVLQVLEIRGRCT